MLYFLCVLICHGNSQEMKSTYTGQMQLRMSLWCSLHQPLLNPCKYKRLYQWATGSINTVLPQSVMDSELTDIN